MIIDAVPPIHGPSFCEAPGCGAWPARPTDLGMRCHLCWCRDVADANPVPLPSNPRMLSDLARIGVAGALEKLKALKLDLQVVCHESACKGIHRTKSLFPH